MLAGLTWYLQRENVKCICLLKINDKQAYKMLPMCRGNLKPRFCVSTGPRLHVSQIHNFCGCWQFICVQATPNWLGLGMEQATVLKLKQGSQRGVEGRVVGKKVFRMTTQTVKDKTPEPKNCLANPVIRRRETTPLLKCISQDVGLYTDCFFERFIIMKNSCQ